MKKVIILIATILFALTPKEYLKIGTQEAIYDAANEYYKMKEYKKAIELYKKINKQTLKFKALYNLGNAYAKSFEFEKAIKAYKEALKIKKDKDALYNLKLIEKLLKKQKNTYLQKKPQKNLQKNKNKNQSKKENKNKKQQKTKNSNKPNKDTKKENKKNKEQLKQHNNQNKKSQSIKGKIEPYPHKENLKQFKTIKNAKTTDIRKRYYMNKLKEMKFNTLLLPLRSKQ